MKKEIIIVFLILLVMIVMNMITRKYTDKVVNDMLGELPNLRENVIVEDYDKAEEKIKNINEKWEKISGILVVYIEHLDIEKAENYIVETKSYIETKERNIAVRSIDALEFALENIKDKYKFTLKNIFWLT